MWRGRRLCSHTIAVAEKAQAMTHFLQWYKKSQQQCNLTKMVTTAKEKKAAGTKGGKDSKRYQQKAPILSY